MKENITPIGSYVLIEPLPIPEKTTGGIIYADKSGNIKGKVLSVPPDTQVQPGDIVMFAGPAATTMDDKGKVVGISEDNILMILNEVS